VTAASIYRAWVNGEFLDTVRLVARTDVPVVKMGPLGTPSSGRNLVAIEVAGYNVNSLLPGQPPSFVQAEVISKWQYSRSHGWDGVPV